MTSYNNEPYKSIEGLNIIPLDYIFREACVSGNLAEVKRLLKDKPNVNFGGKTADGEEIATEITPLVAAINSGNLQIVELLIANSAEVNLKGKYDTYPIHQAAGRGATEILDVLIKVGANINQKTPSGDTALHQAVIGNHEDIVQKLLDQGADATLSNLQGYTPLHTAAMLGNTKIVDVLIENNVKVDFTVEQMNNVASAEIIEKLFTANIGLLEKYNPHYKNSEADFNKLDSKRQTMVEEAVSKIDKDNMVTAIMSIKSVATDKRGEYPRSQTTDRTDDVRDVPQSGPVIQGIEEFVLDEYFVSRVTERRLSNTDQGQTP